MDLMQGVIFREDNKASRKEECAVLLREAADG